MEDNILVLLTPVALVFVPVVIGLVQAIKKAKLVSSRFSAIVAVVLGIGVAYLGDAADLFVSTSHGLTILTGVVIGLTAAGLFSGARAALTGK